MIWLTWRQWRAQASVVAGAAVVLLGFLAVSAGGMPAFGENFLAQLNADRFASAVYTAGIAVVLCLPAVIGVFWGAPLVARELEAGTHRLAWTQSVSRTRWLATKLAVTGVAAMAVTGAISLALTRWASSLDQAVNAGQEQNGLFSLARIAPPLFEARGIAPIAYTAFALALGVTIGMVVRRVVPAMAITLAVFVAVQIVTPAFVREQLGSTSTMSIITAENLRGLLITGDPRDGGPQGPVKGVTIEVNEPGAWLIANQTVDRAGHAQSELPPWFAQCVPGPVAELGGGPPAELNGGPPTELNGGPPRTSPERSAACFKRVRDTGYRQRVTFMPASRYWTLQAIETGIFLALAGLLAAGSFWWLRHRIV